MKILVLNPYFNAEHEVIHTLRRRGAAVLVSHTADEAWNVLQLHGVSVELVIVHREGPNGQGEPGISFIQKFKAASEHKDLPYILTTEKWGPEDCAAHQATTLGANGYLSYPFQPRELPSLVNQIVGAELNEKTLIASAGQYKRQKTSMISVAEAMGKTPEAPREVATLIAMPDQIPEQKKPKPETKKEGATLIAVSESLNFATEHSPIEPKLAPQDQGLSLLSFGRTGPSLQVSVPVGGELTGPKLEPPAELSPGEIEIGEGTEPKLEVSPQSQFSPAADLQSEEPAPSSAPAPRATEGIKEFLLNLFQSKGDAVVPGGAAHTPDAETFKKYLQLREQDVGALSAQLKSTTIRLSQLERQIDEEKSLNSELEHQLTEAKRRLSGFEREKQAAIDTRQKEIDSLQLELRSKGERSRVLESRIREAEMEIAGIRERVRNDIQKIRVREKELENRLEMLKRDSEVLLSTRESKILELKRKLDTAEFNNELLQDKINHARQQTERLQKRLGAIAHAMKLAGGAALDEDATDADGAPLETHDKSA